MPPRVSVVIAAYNAAPFLERAVMSALAQQPPPLEILIVDDASTDETLSVARALGRHSAVRVISLDRNGGPAAARNAAIEAAAGAWLAVLDADDAFLPGHLETLHSVAEEAGADIVLSNFRYHDPATGVSGAAGLPPSSPSRRVDLATYLARARPFGEDADWGLLKPMFRLEFLRRKAVRYRTATRHGEDFLLMVDALLSDARVALSLEPSYLYSHRQSGWSRTTVDYADQISQTAALLSDRRLAGDRTLSAGLTQRIKALQRLTVDRQVGALWRARDGRALVRLLLSDRRAHAPTLRMAARLLKRRLARDRASREVPGDAIATRGLER